jgi:hypothetical protein
MPMEVELLDRDGRTLDRLARSADGRATREGL